MIDTEQDIIDPVAITYRSPMTSEEVNDVIKRPGIYDILVESNGDPKLAQCDQTGFTYNDLHMDVAFQSDQGRYEFAAYRDGDTTTIFGHTPVDESNIADMRALAQRVIGQLYQEIVGGRLPDMAIQQRLAQIIAEYGAEYLSQRKGEKLPDKKIEFYKN